MERESMTNESGVADHGRTTIYHGTPLSPRDALISVCTGRALCVSFFRPDDLEVAEAIAPALMFRSRRFFILDAGNAGRQGMGPSKPGCVVEILLRVARAEVVPSRPVRNSTRQPRRSVAGQRRSSARESIRSQQNGAGLAHGQSDRAAWLPVRTIRPRLLGVDRRPEEGAGWLRCLPTQDGRRRPAVRQRMAPNAYAARHLSCVRLPLRGRRCDDTRPEWVAL